MKAISTSAAIGPYSQAVEANGFLFISGQLPIDPVTGSLAAQDPEGQFRQCLANLVAIAQAACSALSDCIKTLIFVVDLTFFDRINVIYGETFSTPFPARSTFQVAALPKGTLVKTEAIFAIGAKD